MYVLNLSLQNAHHLIGPIFGMGNTYKKNCYLIRKYYLLLRLLLNLLLSDNKQPTCLRQVRLAVYTDKETEDKKWTWMKKHHHTSPCYQTGQHPIEKITNKYKRYLNISIISIHWQYKNTKLGIERKTKRLFKDFGAFPLQTNWQTDLGLRLLNFLKIVVSMLPLV